MEWVGDGAGSRPMPTLLIDHAANCEKQGGPDRPAWCAATACPRRKRHPAAQARVLPGAGRHPREGGRSSAAPFMGEAERTVFAELERNPLLFPMVRLIQEELHHFEQVLEIMQARGISYGPVTAARYARSLLAHVRTYEPAAVVDKMIIRRLYRGRDPASVLPGWRPIWTRSLAASTSPLLRSEARHYQDYLPLAGAVCGRDISERVAYFGRIEAELIRSPDSQFQVP